MTTNTTKLFGIAFSVALLGAWIASPIEAQERRTAKRTTSSSSKSSSSSKARSSSPSRSSSNSTQSTATRSTATRSTATSSDESKRKSSTSSQQNQRELRSRWRGKSQGSHHSHYPRHPYYWDPDYYHYRYSWSPYFSWYGYYPWYYGSRSVHYEPGPDTGALDFDVTPETAEIYLDGKPIGQADDYDGFPTYLWLPKGTYDVVIYQPGYESISRQYSVYSGVIIDIEDEMRPGEARRPEELVTQSTRRRDTRVREDRDRARDVSARDDWRDRDEDVGEDTEGETWRRQDADDDEPWEESRGQEEAKGELTGVLYLDVNPTDSAVYVDGRFMGTAEEFGRSVGLVLDPGEHALSVVHPAFEKVSRHLEVEPGEALRLKIDLDD